MDDSSGHIDTVSCFAYTYGRAEFRARFPHATDPWYAVWAKPWSEALPEIDVDAYEGLRGPPAIRIGNERAAYSKAAEIVDVQVADVDLDCAQVAMYANGKLVDTRSKPPFKFDFAKVPAATTRSRSR